MYFKTSGPGSSSSLAARSRPSRLGLDAWGCQRLANAPVLAAVRLGRIVARLACRTSAVWDQSRHRGGPSCYRVATELDPRATILLVDAVGAFVQAALTKPFSLPESLQRRHRARASERALRSPPRGDRTPRGHSFCCLRRGQHPVLPVPCPILRLLLQRAPRACRCRARLDERGDHHSACAASGVLALRLRLERAARRPAPM